MKLISFDDIAKLNISPALCYQWVSEMIQQKASAILPPKISMKPDESIFYNVMPSLLMGLDEPCGGVKLVTRYPVRTPSLDSKILLFDFKEGKCQALLDGNWITAMRTGAVAAHSIKLLAKKDYSVLGLMGLGNTGRAALLVLACMEPKRRFTVKLLRYKGQEELFAERFAEYENLSFTYVDSVEELVRGTDVVISAVTYLSDDICADECFDEGVLVVPIHTRGFSNCDLFFDKVYADDYGHVHHFKYFERFKSFAETSDVVNAKAAGRENDRERILVYNIGVAMHDIYFASQIYKMIEKMDTVKEIELLEPTDKFWV